MKYTAEEVRARLGFVISDHEPRILTWESGGCRQTSMAECALWDALAECIKADEGAAQVDQVGELLAIIHGDGGHYQAEHGLQKAAKDAQEKVIQMMTKIATAEPAAPGEAVSGVDLHDRIEFALRDAGFGLDEASILAERATAQPAQSVDVEKVREVIAELRDYDDSAFNVWADKLEAALQEKGNG